MSEDFAVPDSLVQRCARHFGWSDAKRESVLVAYRQYMELVRHLEDWNSIMLIPPAYVDCLWLAHVLLDEQQYVKACMDYCGTVVRHHSTALNTKTETARMVTIQICVQARFDKDKVDAEIWSFANPAGVDASYAFALALLHDAAKMNHHQQQQQNQQQLQIVPSTKIPPLPHQPQPEPSSQQPPQKPRTQKQPDSLARVAAGSKSEKITITLATEAGQTKALKIKPSIKMGGFFDDFAKRCNIPTANLVFLHNGQPIERGQTPKTLKLRNNDTIIIATVVQVIFYCPQLKQETPIKMKRSMPMGMAFDQYLLHNRVPTPQQVRFYTRAGEIARSDTPKTLGLVEGSQVVAHLCDH